LAVVGKDCVRVCHVGCSVDVMNMTVGNMGNFHADAANFLVLVAERDAVRRTLQIRGLEFPEEELEGRGGGLRHIYL
jgi:uncharacterized protein